MIEINKNIVWHESLVSAESIEKRNGHKGAILWFTGLSGSGKSTLANAVNQSLFNFGCNSFVLDGDNVRHGLCSDLGFSATDREENIRRIGEVAKLFLNSGCIVSAAFVSPFENDRQLARKLVNDGQFIEIYCAASLLECEKRDTKGLYAKARAGEIRDFTGISSNYEEPKSPEIVVDTGKEELINCVNLVIKKLSDFNIISNS